MSDGGITPLAEDYWTEEMAPTTVHFPPSPPLASSRRGDDPPDLEDDIAINVRQSARRESVPPVPVASPDLLATTAFPTRELTAMEEVSAVAEWLEASARAAGIVEGEEAVMMGLVSRADEGEWAVTVGSAEETAMAGQPMMLPDVRVEGEEFDDVVRFVCVSVCLGSCLVCTTVCASLAPVHERGAIFSNL